MFRNAHVISNHKCLQYTNLVPSVRIYAFNQCPYYGYFLDLTSKDICRPINQSVDGSCFFKCLPVCLSNSLSVNQSSTSQIGHPVSQSAFPVLHQTSQSARQSACSPASQSFGRSVGRLLGKPACMFVFRSLVTTWYPTSQSYLFL